jgi:hypothetical protein
MTKAEITLAIRNIIGELSTDSGVLLTDDENLLEFIHDAEGQVCLDLMPSMPSAFLTSENVSLVANQANYTLTNSFWQIWKVERTITGEPPTEIAVIDPIEMQYHTETGETESEPHACYFIGDVLYFVRTPSENKTDYAKVWEIRPEADTMPTTGPAYIPSVAHRLIVYQACVLIATLLERDPSPYMALYARRLQMVDKVWRGRFQSQTRFVRPGAGERQANFGSSEDRDRGW